MGNLKTNTNSHTMIANKTITIAAVGFAYANAVTLKAQVETEDIIGDIGGWFEGAANDTADWFEGAYKDAVSWSG